MLKILIIIVVVFSLIFAGYSFIDYVNNQSRLLMDNDHKGLRELNYNFNKELAVSDDEKIIAFNHGTADLKEYLYTANIDGTSVKSVPNSEGGSKPAFSKDSKKLAFITKNGDSYGDQEQIESTINIVNLTSNTLEQSIPLKGYNIWEVAFSPDGSGLYFINTQQMTNTFSSSFKSPSDYDIFYLSLNDQSAKNETNFKKEAPLMNPTINNLHVGKDGAIRFVMSKDLYSDSIYELKGGLDELYHSTGTIYHSEISADGSKIVIVEPAKEDNLEPTFDLYSTHTGERKILMDKGSVIASPRFLNSEKRIMFFLLNNLERRSAEETSKIRAIDQGKDYQLMTINFDGSDPQKINLSIP